MSYPSVTNTETHDQRETASNNLPTLISEMEQTGIDVNFLIEIAAHDLVVQFGDKALDYSIQIEQDFLLANDMDSMMIWNKISSYLSSLNGQGKLIAH